MVPQVQPPRASPQALPQHVAIIMDGNGRWAARRHLHRLAGHRKGAERARQVTEAASQLGLKALTLYAFSHENWQRPQEEVMGLMGLLKWYVETEAKTLLKNNVRFRMVGDRSKLSRDLLKKIEQLEKDSLGMGGLNLTLALSYGSHWELTCAAQKLAQMVKKGLLDPQSITPELMANQLETAPLPPVDLMIRTGGEQRISNFLLWQISYAELVFNHRLWPDYDTKAFHQDLATFQSRERRFGLTAPLGPPGQRHLVHKPLSPLEQGL